MKLLRIPCCAAFVSLTLLLLSRIPTTADSAGTGVLEKADAATRNVPSYRMTMTVTDKRGVQINTLEYVKPDRYRILVDGRKMEMIIIGKTTYMKTGGQWRKSPIDIGDSIDQMRPALTREVLQKSTVKRIGAETLDSVPTTIYQVTYSDSNIHTDSKYWISDQDNLIRKMTGTSDTANMEVLGKVVGGKSSYTSVIDYKASVTIAAPKDQRRAQETTLRKQRT